MYPPSAVVEFVNSPCRLTTEFDRSSHTASLGQSTATEIHNAAIVRFLPSLLRRRVELVGRGRRAAEDGPCSVGNCAGDIGPIHHSFLTPMGIT